MPVLGAALSALGAYAVLFAANLRLLHYQRSSVVPQVNAWFDGTACLAGLVAVLTATVVPALTARGVGTATALAWSVRPALVLVLVAFAAANCGLVAPDRRRRPLTVLALFVLLLLAEVADLAHLVLGAGGPAGLLTPAAAGLRLLALPLLVRTLRTPAAAPRWWPTSAGRRWPPRSPSSS